MKRLKIISNTMLIFINDSFEYKNNKKERKTQNGS